MKPGVVVPAVMHGSEKDSIFRNKDQFQAVNTIFSGSPVSCEALGFFNTLVSWTYRPTFE